MTSLSPLALLVAAILPVVTCYSTGAPPDGCWTERPLHGDYLPLSTCPPFVLELEKVNKTIPDGIYRPKEIIKVTIRSTDGTPFKGYLIKVTSSNGVTSGKWATRRGLQKYIPQCGVTHSKADNYTQVTILWRAPPQNDMRTIQFRAIVVQDRAHFYNNILSESLTADYPVPDHFMQMWNKWNALLDFNFTSPVNDLTSSVQQVSSLVSDALDAARGSGSVAQDVLLPPNVHDAASAATTASLDAVKSTPAKDLVPTLS